MGQYHYRQWLKTSELFSVSGIYDINPDRYEVAQKDGMKNYNRFYSREEIAADPDTDAVLIATPNDVHYEYVCFFAQSKKHIICEKPVAMNCAEYSEMLKICEQNNVNFIVHQNRRWDPDFLTVRKIYSENQIGTIHRIESRVQGGNGIPGDWRKFAEKGGGMMLDWGVHLIDQFVYMLPEIPQSVYCRYSYHAGFDVDDGFCLTLNYRNGLVAEIVVDTDCFIPLPRWMIYGEEGTAVIQDWEMNGKIVKPVYAKELKIAGIQAGNGFTKTMAYRTAESIETMEIDKVYPPENAFYKEFYDAVVNGKTPLIRADQVMAVLNIMEAAAQSARENKVIELEETSKR